jgi:hypothetical protein
MATLPQAPFYVKRPAEDQLWSPGTQPRRSPIIQFLTEQKMFGAGGQVPTKQSCYDYQETGVWAPVPENLNSGIIPVLAKRPTATARQWQFGYNEPHPWQIKAELLNSATIQILGRPTIGNGPQWFFIPPDPADWSRWQSPNIVANSGPATIPRAPFRISNPPDPPSWQGKTVTSKNLPSGAPTKPRTWRFDYSETGSWQIKAELLNSAPIQILAHPVIGNGPQWFFTTYDTPWQISVDYLNAAPLQMLQPPFSRVWHTDYDDAPNWQMSAEWLNSAAIPMLTTGGQPPTPNWHQYYDYDEAAIWAPTPDTLNSFLTLTTVIINPPVLFYPPFYVPRPGDPPDWYATPTEVPLTMEVVQSPQPPNARSPSFANDDAAFWQWTAPNPAALSLVPYKTSGMEINYYDDDNYLQGPRSSNLPILNTPQAVPFSPAYWKKQSVDDWSVWQWQALRANVEAILSQNKPFTARQWNSYTDDQPVWQPANETLNSAPIQILTSGGRPPQKKWNYDYNDASHWFPWANGNLLIHTPQPNPLIPTFWPHLAFNEPAVTWQPALQRPVVIPPAPLYQNRYNFTVPDDPIWYRTPVRDQQIFTLAQAVPFIPGVWKYDHDFSKMWAWQAPPSSLIAPVLAGRPNFNWWSWNYNADQPAIWQQPHQGLLNGPFPPPVQNPPRIVPWWTWNIYEPPVWWQQTPQRGLVFTLPVPIIGVPSLAFCVDIPVFSANALDLLLYTSQALDNGLFVAIGSDSPSGQGWSGAGYMGVYEIDTDIQINGIFINALTGVDIDPTAITLFMLNPNGVATSYTYPGTITRDSLGHFHQQLVPSVSGVWTYKWQATGAAVCTSPDTSFTVKSSLLIPG